MVAVNYVGSFKEEADYKVNPILCLLSWTQYKEAGVCGGAAEMMTHH